MKKLKPESLLGVGLYTPTDAAMYARVRTSTMKRWIYGDKRSDPVVTPQLDSEERIVTFLDFIQSMAIRAIRLTRKMPLQKIRQAVEMAQDDYGVSFPLARQHTTFVINDELVLSVDGKESKRLVTLTGKYKRYQAIPQVAEVFMQDVGFDAQGFAKKYSPLTHGDFKILMQPDVRFGEPLVDGTGYTARCLWDAATAEGSIEAAAAIYEVPIAAVSPAIRYIDMITTSAAA